MSDYADKALRVLKENQFRITHPRKLVIELLDKSKKALSPYEIKEKLDSSNSHVDIVSVYRIVECLEKNHLVHRVLTTGKIMKCQLKHESDCKLHRDDHCHHLLICEKCASVEEIHCAGIPQIVQKLEKDSKFKIRKHNLEFYGICRKCS